MKIICNSEGNTEYEYLIVCPRCYSVLLADAKDIRFYAIKSVNINFDAHRYFCPCCKKDIDHHVINSTPFLYYPKGTYKV